MNHFMPIKRAFSIEHFLAHPTLMCNEIRPMSFLAFHRPQDRSDNAMRLHVLLEISNLLEYRSTHTAVQRARRRTLLVNLSHMSLQLALNHVTQHAYFRERRPA